MSRPLTPEEAYVAGANDVKRAFGSAQQLFDRGTITAEARPATMRMLEIQLRDERIAAGQMVGDWGSER